MNQDTLNNIFSQLQDSIKQVENKQANTIFSATSGGGLVKASVNGNCELVDLHIDESLFEDKESLQILLIGAINEAYKQADNGKKNAAMELFGDLSPFK